MLGLSAIILSYTNSQKIHDMNLACIDSLQKSENFGQAFSLETIVIESNKNYLAEGYRFPSNVKVIVPDIAFNFHRFLNIGIQASEGQYVALCNNDLLFHKGWFTAMMNVIKEHPEFRSFCPVQPSEQWSSPFEMGYAIRTHIKGWCIVAERGLFNTTGLLDEQFDFYYADDDYGMTLRKYRIPHAVVSGSVVEHLGGANTDSSREEGKAEYSRLTIDRPGLPKYLYTEGYRWILRNEKLLDGHLRFHKKWGSMRSIALKLKFTKVLKPLGLSHWINW